MPTFTWNIDPVLIGLVGGAVGDRSNGGVVVIPILYAALALAVFAAGGAFMSRRAGDRGGLISGLVFAVAFAVVGVMSQSWEVWWGIRYYSLLFVVVFLGGYGLLHWQVKRGGGGQETAGDFIIYGVIAVLVGARLGHVIFYDLEHALEDPLWIFAIHTGGLASHGATIGLVVAMWIFAARKGTSFLDASDRFAFSAALGAALVRLGNFLNSEIVGHKTDGSWGVRFPKTCVTRPDGDRECWGFDDALRHPSQLYEVGLGLLVLLVLFVADRAWGKEKRPRGAMISLFIVLYFIGRFIVEFWKEFQVNESWEETVTMGQLLSLPGVAIGAYGLWWSFKQRLPAGWGVGARRRYDDAEDVEEEEDEEAEAEVLERKLDDDVEEEFGGRAGKRARRAKEKRDAAKKRRTQKRAAAAAAAKKDEHDGLDKDEDEDDELDRDEDEGETRKSPAAKAQDEDDELDEDVDDEKPKAEASRGRSGKKRRKKR